MFVIQFVSSLNAILISRCKNKCFKETHVHSSVFISSFLFLHLGEGSEEQSVLPEEGGTIGNTNNFYLGQVFLITLKSNLAWDSHSSLRQILRVSPVTTHRGGNTVAFMA